MQQFSIQSDYDSNFLLLLLLGHIIKTIKLHRRNPSIFLLRSLPTTVPFYSIRPTSSEFWIRYSSYCLCSPVFHQFNPCLITLASSPYKLLNSSFVVLTLNAPCPRSFSVQILFFLSKTPDSFSYMFLRLFPEQLARASIFSKVIFWY